MRKQADVVADQIEGRELVDQLCDAAPARIRGVNVTREEPLCVEWDVVVVTPHLAAAFVARDLGDEDVEDWDRHFEFALTYDRDLAVAASSALMSRVIDASMGETNAR